MIPIIIPTYKTKDQIREVLFELKCNISDKKYVLIPTFVRACASVNRNFGIMMAEKYGSDIIIMVDDDVTGYYKNWADDLIKPLLSEEHKECVMVSARLMHDNNTVGVMMDHKIDLSVEYQIVQNALPSAAVAFRYDKIIRFDEIYSVDNMGSQWEDTDACFQYNKKYPNCYYIINNRCKLIHKNEAKESKYGNYFRSIFQQKWGIK